MLSRYAMPPVLNGGETARRILGSSEIASHSKSTIS
jgi:hypothetical protein